MSVVVHRTQSDHASTFGFVNNVLVVIGHTAPDAESARNYARATHELGQRHPDGIGLVTIVKEAATPNAEARRLLVNNFRDHARFIHGVMFVVEASGFAAAIQRSVMNAFTLASGVSGKVRIFKEVSDGVPSLLRRIVMDVDAEDLSRAISRFRDAG